MQTHMQIQLHLHSQLHFQSGHGQDWDLWLTAIRAAALCLFVGWLWWYSGWRCCGLQLIGAYGTGIYGCGNCCWHLEITFGEVARAFFQKFG